MLKKVLFTIGVIIILIAVLYPFASVAQPTSSLYSFKRLGENVVLVTKIAPDAKADFYSILLDRRLHELEVIVGKRQNFVLSAALRYSTMAGKYAEIIKQNNLKREAAKAREQFIRHKETLIKLEEKYERHGDTDDTWKFIRDAINYIDIYSTQLPT